MPTRFTVSGYRGFREPVTLDLSKPRDYAFNTSNVTVGVVTNALVVGPNASGKTNLLRAMGDIRSNYYPPDDPLASPGGDEGFLNADAGDGAARFEYELLLGSARLDYSYDKGRDRSISRETLRLDGRTVFDCGSAGELLEADLGLVDADSLNWRFAGGYSSALAYVSSNAPVRRGGVLDDLRRFTQSITLVLNDGWGSASRAARYLDLIARRDLVGELEGFLRGFGIDQRLVVLRDADGSRAVCCAYARPVPFASCMSSGTRTLVSLFYAYRVLPRGTLYLLDEFDAYCHYELAERLVRYFGGEAGRQTISTTHNTSLVRNDVMRPDCVFKFGDDGSLRALSERTDRELRFGNNVERLLRNGEFG